MRKYLLDSEELMRSGRSGLLSLNLEDDRRGYLWSLDPAEFPETEPPHSSIEITKFDVTITVVTVTLHKDMHK